MRARWSVVLVLSSLVGCSRDENPSSKPSPQGSTSSRPGAEGAGAASEVNPRLLRRFQTVASPYDAPTDATTSARIALGRQLFFEPRLSKDRDISCNTCHDLGAFGVDSQPTSSGFKKQRGGRNSPTVLNASLSFVQFWDGRAPDLEAQAKEPILNPIEMAMPDAAAVEAVLRGIPGYVEGFKKAFPDAAQPVTYDNLGVAIGTFERGLVTPGRWDRYLKGEKDALSVKEREGLKVFLDIGCMVCHTGPALGGSMFERVGAVEPWPNQADKGRATVTHSAGDEMMFKVPTLRNIEKTAPYFHDGSAANLEDAVRLMGKHQLGLELSPVEITAIATWLKSLTSAPPPDYVAKPELPR